MNAKKILAERFGDAYRVSKSWLTRVSNGPPIKPGDKEGLQELADDLLNCEITLKATGRLAQLDNEDRLVKIMERCPVFVRARWQKHVLSIRLEGRDPNVEDVRQLIRAVAMEKNDPVFGSILDGNSRELPKRSKLRKPAQSNIQLQSFSVQQNNDKPDVKCYFCEGQHRLENCEKFKRQLAKNSSISFVLGSSVTTASHPSIFPLVARDAMLVPFLSVVFLVNI